MDLMNRTFRPYLDQFVVVFIDDILVYSKNAEDHEQYLRTVLQILREQMPYTKFSKFEFWMSEIKFMGHVITRDRISVNPGKVETVQNWKEPSRTRLLFSVIKVEPVLISKIVEIRGNLKTALSRYKSYTDNRRRPLEFSVEDKVFLKVSPTKGVTRFGKKGKLAPRFIGPFEILERIGSLAYRLALPPSLSGVHNVFHVSMLRKYEPDPSHVLSYDPSHNQYVPIREDLTYIEHPVEILDPKEKVLRNKTIVLVKVLWRHHSIEEATWERRDEMVAKYPNLFNQE